jgi:hypothetical protein
MIVAIHQPNYIPWLGYFYKLHQCDTFVFLDNVQLPRGRSFVTRNRIKTPQGERWLTIPCKRKGKTEQLICETDIDDSLNWQAKHWETLRHSYGKAPYFGEYYDLFNRLYQEEWTKLAKLNEYIIEMLCKALGLNHKFTKASALGIDGGGTQLLINICKAVGANIYLSGFGGANYQEEELFREAGIALKYYEFEHPVYPQLWGDFSPNLSIIDLLFNCGPESMDIILGKKSAA